MASKNKSLKDELIVFRAPKPVAKSLDILAKLIGSSRSEVLRRLIPDLNKKGVAK